MGDEVFVYKHKDCGTVTHVEQDAKLQGSVYCPKCMMFRPQSEYDRAEVKTDKEMAASKA